MKKPRAFALLRSARRTNLLAAAFVAIGVSVAVADRSQAETCKNAPVASELAYLRRLSFDLRGRAPDYEELESVAKTDQRVRPETIDAMLASDRFTATMRDDFRDLLSINLAQDLGSELNLLVTTQAGGGFPDSAGIYWNPNRARLYRGGNQAVPCTDVAASFSADGLPVTKVDTELGSGAQREGWVLVHPYWAADPSFKVKVCAFDAASKELSTSGQRCDERNYAADCGCGVDGRVCEWRGAAVPNGSTNTTLNRAIVEQVLRSFDRVVKDGRPYTEILTSKEIEISGPISHFLQYQSRATAIGFFARPDIGLSVPKIPFHQEATWTRVTQTGQVAGVLTSPFYLVKYSSNRGRANRFYNAFLCSYFQASAAGLPDPSDDCTKEPNITKRCGCKDCHASLEPSASHWGRWAERGVHPLPASEFPRLDPACATATPAASCESFRLVAADVTHPSLEPYKGVLRAYVFAEPFEANIDAGPEKIAKEAIDSGQLAACTTRRLFTRFVGRAPREWPEERAELDRISQRFTEGYDLRRLVKDLVALPQYKADGR